MLEQQARCRSHADGWKTSLPVDTGWKAKLRADRERLGLSAGHVVRVTYRAKSSRQTCVDEEAGVGAACVEVR
jgi:hypothetical protein